jgi:hypothetical protein
MDSSTLGGDCRFAKTSTGESLRVLLVHHPVACVVLNEVLTVVRDSVVEYLADRLANLRLSHLAHRSEVVVAVQTRFDVTRTE